MQSGYKLSLIPAALFSAIVAQASELPEYYRGTRASAMGGAYTCVSDDIDGVFYNPAGLALSGSSRISLPGLRIGVSDDDLRSIPLLRNLGSSGLDLSSANQLFGKHFYGEVSAFPAVTFPGFVMGYYFDSQFHIVARNTSLPTVEASYLYDRGVVTGYGYETRGFTRKHHFRLGVSVLWLTRIGYAGAIPVTTMITASKSTLKTLRAGPDTGWGLTPGLQYEIPVGHRDDLVFGSAWQNIGNTQFGGAAETGPPPPIKNNLSAGVAYLHRFGAGFSTHNNVKLTGEMRNLWATETDPRLKMHVGTELDLGFLAVQGGINQDSFTWGMTMRLPTLEISVVSYAVEDQALAYLDRERRYMLSLSFHLDTLAPVAKTERERERKKHPRDY